MNTVILISGKSNSGKGTVANLIMNNISDNYNKIQSSLSTYIRDILKNDFFCDNMNTDTAREFMGEVYRLGTKIYPYHMARRVWERDNKPFLNKNKDNILVIESFRELNNYIYFKELLNKKEIDKIITIRVERPNFNILKDENRVKHISEVDLDNFDFNYYIYNNNGINELNKKIIDLLNSIKLI